MFDRIAHRYDLLNHLLSFRRDVSWRKCLVKNLPEETQQCVLDLATGTGDVLIHVCRRSGRLRRGVGLDMSAHMLRRADTKIAQMKLGGKLNLVRSDASAIAFADNTFGSATMAFGIRNVPDPQKALNDIHRVLKPSGRALILEFSLPSNQFIKALYLLYFRHILPRIGALISGDNQAYRYLNRSVESFPHGKAFLELMRKAGFQRVHATPLTFGIATLYRGDKIP